MFSCDLYKNGESEFIRTINFYQLPKNGDTIEYDDCIFIIKEVRHVFKNDTWVCNRLYVDLIEKELC